MAGCWEKGSIFSGFIKGGKCLGQLSSNSNLVQKNNLCSSGRRICKDVSSFTLIGRIKFQLKYVYESQTLLKFKKLQSYTRIL